MRYIKPFTGDVHITPEMGNIKLNQMDKAGCVVIRPFEAMGVITALISLLSAEAKSSLLNLLAGRETGALS